MTDVTQILSQIESGDPSAAEQLLPLVYGELRKLAAHKLAQEKPGQDPLNASGRAVDAQLAALADEAENGPHVDSAGDCWIGPLRPPTSRVGALPFLFRSIDIPRSGGHVGIIIAGI